MMTVSARPTRHARPKLEIPNLSLLDKAIKDPGGLSRMESLQARVAWASLKKQLEAQSATHK